jgi:fatty-acid desaturase
MLTQKPYPSMRVLRFNTPRKNEPDKNQFNWLIATFLALFHLGAFAALFFFTWKALFVALFLYWVTAVVGIGLTYHRLLTHRSFQTPKWLEYFLTICAVTAVEGGPLLWVATHRMHHQFTDAEGDPHSPREGKWWAHAGWILVGNALRQDETTLERYVPDLAQDKFHVWITEFHFVPTIILGIILFLVGGWPFLLWGIFFRTVAGYHATWLINSATHIWGSRRFQTRDRSTNNWWVAVLTLGEGWHNNHHAQPTSARHGHKWWELDLAWMTIRVMMLFGLATEVIRPSASLSAKAP